MVKCYIAEVMVSDDLALLRQEVRFSYRDCGRWEMTFALLRQEARFSCFIEALVR